MTVIMISDDLEFLTATIEEVVKNDIMIWPARLLIVSRLSPQKLLHLRQALSTINAMLISFENTPKLQRYGIYAIWPYSLRMVHTASWSPNSGLKLLPNQQLFPNKFRRFPDGAHFRVAAMNYPPHFHVGAVSAQEFTYSGPLWLYLEMLAAHANFTYNILQPKEGAWGFVSSNGTWNGMIGMILRNEVDFALGPFARIYIRSTVVDYADTMIVLYAAIVGRRGKAEVDPWGFTMPLAPEVWAATFATLFIIIVAKMVISRLDKESPVTRHSISLGTYVRAFLQQNIESDTNNEWERMFLGWWLLTVLVLLEAYSTNLISLLAVRHIREPYQTVRQVMDDPNVKMIWFANSAYLQFISQADTGIFQEVWKTYGTERMRLVGPAEYVETVDRLVGRGDHVVIHPYLSMKLFLTEDFMDKGNCKYYVSDERFMPMDFSPIYPKHSPLGVFLINGVRAAFEGGLYSYWLDTTMTNPKSCRYPPTKIIVQEALTLGNIWGMFATLVAGYIISIVAFCLELASTRSPVFPKSSS
ncbi:glutamate receptor ionotropic, kainate glr-3-like [Palaemon carinicauda]|uniref:glutamate receptor ionotropic, kainate glr-3-like n=1 Tax=Palaemon carinicauda TaxID=392227 RepID=UPI0035B579E7